MLDIPGILLKYLISQLNSWQNIAIVSIIAYWQRRSLLVQLAFLSLSLYQGPQLVRDYESIWKQKATAIFSRKKQEALEVAAPIVKRTKAIVEEKSQQMPYKLSELKELRWRKKKRRSSRLSLLAAPLKVTAKSAVWLVKAPLRLLSTPFGQKFLLPLLPALLWWLWYNRNYYLNGIGGSGDDLSYEQPASPLAQQQYAQVLAVALQQQEDEAAAGQSPQLSFAQVQIGGVIEQEEGVLSSGDLEFWGATLGISAAKLPRWVVGIQQLQRAVRDGEQPQAVLDAFIAQRGEMLLPGEEPALGEDLPSIGQALAQHWAQQHAQQIEQMLAEAEAAAEAAADAYEQQLANEQAAQEALLEHLQQQALNDARAAAQAHQAQLDAAYQAEQDLIEQLQQQALAGALAANEAHQLEQLQQEQAEEAAAQEAAEQAAQQQAEAEEEVAEEVQIVAPDPQGQAHMEGEQLGHHGNGGEQQGQVEGNDPHIQQQWFGAGEQPVPDKPDVNISFLGALPQHLLSGAQQVSREVAERTAKESANYLGALQGVKNAESLNRLAQQGVQTAKTQLGRTENLLTYHASRKFGITIDETILSNRSAAQQGLNSATQRAQEARNGLENAKVGVQEVLETETNSALTRLGTQEILKNAGKKIATGAAVALVVEYAIPTASVGWDCYRGNNEAMNECVQRCTQRRAQDDGWGTTFKNGWDRTATFGSEFGQAAPPIHQAAPRAAAGSAGAYVGGVIGSMLGPAGVVLGGMAGGYLGNKVGGWIGSWWA